MGHVLVSNLHMTLLVAELALCTQHVPSLACHCRGGFHAHAAFRCTPRFHWPTMHYCMGEHWTAGSFVPVS